MLKLEHVSAAYGQSPVLFDIDLEVRDAEAVALIGRNGVGKSTLLRTISGLHPVTAGGVRLGGEAVEHAPAFARARAGLAYVPQGRGLFSHLTVEENLLMGLSALGGRPATKKEIPPLVYDLFPICHDMRARKAGNLSGGQQQQVAIGRALVTRPAYLLLDEPTEGIQPSIVQDIEAALGRIRAELRVAVLLVEQYLDFAWAFADRYYVLQRGRVVESGLTADVQPSAVQRYLSV
ncbi:urea ABC transporter ATP-binding subunit UrtE [Deinococcus radiodurans]|jgi:urea ABC transporter ATP-binding protein|uniref:Urea/short-chain amide ABC transporter, ATP-binding protein, putative n=1 Tax=Deinococcus radiodurans (strain ATCC 13939 / DSM 20539 / JCM 16871 / CCUG 27074 / LMG 4051 / NBRC 15346 / NCIMB 9279 / VKM B-1422 / R1) TaxID=243230 RepID=Q9RYI8_DEIRA|nr:urea ABC transporter ATP-binding subunit UrtE [Deinococcus radiodurans]AAF12455.1 urea/short-chain amide ABC transporter, ATP-binding protein, putative [Deinococcus radiodurans R1 = ATCC 13939 = DSM 20539]ANC72835.1 ABC transporter ATP-binding protein [Deinococcus radiodurans R1 = ATCC 13939 = DSM 20539]QEM73109.1 urea ABC transporter ATP-binding subunit UrtE [Deinococcus radiodurans]QIP30525.1 urea ABC transporter ATP-binding subunit UrtE [Deinococcus radiodurans]QIP33420.1 urea ABC transp